MDPLAIGIQATSPPEESLWLAFRQLTGCYQAGFLAQIIEEWFGKIDLINHIFPVVLKALNKLS
jgi:hypothetical protein